MKDHATILTKGYDLQKEIIPTVNKLPRDQRFILGTKIENLSLEILELLIEAYYLPKSEKAASLHRVNLQLEKLRYLLRLGFELRYYSSKRYQHLTKLLLELGRMTGGWIKSLS